jgi:ribosomal protein S18 acetylase RimI-like enzyme
MTRAQRSQIREFRESEVAAVGGLIHHTIDACYARVYSPGAVQFFKDFHSEAAVLERSRQGTTLVVERDGTVIATGTVVGCNILGVFVHPTFQHRGHGKALMRQLESKAKDRGCSEILLSVSLPSRRFYEGLGYQVLEESRIDLGGGEHLDFWSARKALVAADAKGP